MLLIAGMATFIACGPSAKEKEAKEKAKQDSIALAEKTKKAQDSIAQIKAKAKEDSIAKVKEQAKQDSIANAKKAPKKAEKKSKGGKKK